MLKAGLQPLWRDRETLQIGVDPRRAVALRGLGQTTAVISLLDGSRDTDAVLAAAAAHGIPAEAASRVLGLLAGAGVLDDCPGWLHTSLPEQLRARLAPELATASLAYLDGDGGARVLARRRAAFVRVHGAGRIGAGLASFLAAAGVGRVTCADPAPAEPADLSPGGLILADIGRPRQDGAARAIARAAPEARTGEDGAAPDLVILAGPVPPDLAAVLAGDRVPHLAVRCQEAIGVVGPMVLPGRSACLRCVDLRKAEADPAWPKIMAQLTFARVRPQACDTVLAAMTATLAAAQALAYLDRAGSVAARPVTVNGTLELALPGWQWRRRTWPPHCACNCGAQRVSQPGGGAFPHQDRRLDGQAP
jgi:hypothetical protein